MLKEYDLGLYNGAGTTGRKFRGFVNLPGISEPEAIEYALHHTGTAVNHELVLSAGGESFMVYVLGKDGNIASVHTGNKCASGTGEFFLQQIRRMNLNVEEALGIAKVGHAHKISGRCSVFCKSDCTHALNKGTEKGAVVTGLCEMIGTKMLELINKARKKKVLVIGGVSRNFIAMEFLRAHVDVLTIPEEAPYFEALGAALWALEQNAGIKINPDTLFKENHSHFDFLPRLAFFEDKVIFKTMSKSVVQPGDECIIGLDVGSTTTKAVLFRLHDDAILASIYLRTNGDPVGASRNCYRELAAQIKGISVKIIGLGVTGSGRQIAGLHALTKGIINEIIAHANASVFFDKEVDTIFEIGGQDAKYTYITNGVPSDYAMNEACSAGTGSFLEESAKESLNINVTDIADIALRAQRPPNFNDQCAAFISSDIKNASHEGIPKEDIVAGLIYSICMNYVNRVKGARPVGKKVFMQGGVCYNKAVPIAMAALTGKEIIVPPDPGLMGAFGVALVIKDKLKLGLIQEQEFNLEELAQRTVEYLKPFVCPGGAEKCDRKCTINTLKINGKSYPFGGACNKYYNIQHEQKVHTPDFNHVESRQQIIFAGKAKDSGRTIGVNRSFLTNSYFPLYYTFFTRLGFRVILPDFSDPEGVNRSNAAFCYPYEISHGMFKNLLDKNTDYLFMPHILELEVPGITHKKNTCVFVQSEQYVLTTTFREETENRKILAPKINFAAGYESQRHVFTAMAGELHVSSSAASHAFSTAVNAQKKAEAQIRTQAGDILTKIEHTGEFAVVLFGRPYNAFPKEANLAIPAKFASRGIHVIPFNALPYEKEEHFPGMYWAMGQIILKSARIVKRHPLLFGAYVTNFSCGPDSFVVGFFRDVMGMKPSLTLELDSQTADAGVDTRIEAFLDVVHSYRELQKKNMLATELPPPPTPEVYLRGRRTRIVLGKKTWKLKDIHLILPSMGLLSTQAVAAAGERAGVRTSALPPPDVEDLKLGKGNTSCKECLPLILTTGSLLSYLTRRTDTKEFTAFFMPKQIDPCRLCQYHGFFNKLIRRNRLENVAVISLSDYDGYNGLGFSFRVNLWLSFILADVMDDVYSALITLADNREEAKRVFNEEWEQLLGVIRSGKNVFAQVRRVSERLGQVKKKQTLSETTKILLTGEMYVRKDDISRQYLMDRLSEKNIIVKVSATVENVLYSNYLTRKRIDNFRISRYIQAHFENLYYHYTEKKLRTILSGSGLCDTEMIDVDKTMRHAEHLVGKHIKGETSLTVGTGLRDILHHVSGIISIGPFGCMPSRVAEAVLTREMTMEGKIKSSQHADKNTGNVSADPLLTQLQIHELPFLAIESDASVFPQVIEARLETFCLQANRLHAKTKHLGNNHRA